MDENLPTPYEEKHTQLAEDEAADETQEATLLCPLCGIEVQADALTCPRCKSRMDAHPLTPFALADTFDAWNALGEEEATARMSLSFHTGMHTGPLPTLTLDEHAQVSDEWSEAASLPAQEDAQTTIEEADESQFVPLEPRRNGRHVAGAIAAVVLLGSFLAGGAHLAAQANTLNQIDEARITADIYADETFLQGSASDDFVEPQAYAIDSLRINNKQTAEGGVDVAATVGISNSYFAESRDVVVHYRKATDENASEDGWVHECVVESHAIRPVRGISHDSEQGLEELAPELDSSGLACTVELPYEATGNAWYATTSGTRVFSYTFAHDAWSRTDIQEVPAYTSYQHLIGTYAQSSTESSNSRENESPWSFGTSSRNKASLDEFCISWVDDESKTFGGWFSWQTPQGLLSSRTQMSGAFSGSIDDSGALRVDSNEQANSLEFDAVAAQDGALRINGIAYTEASSLWRESSVESNKFTTTVYKLSDEVGSMPTQQTDTSFDSAQEGSENEDAEHHDNPEDNELGNERPNTEREDNWDGFWNWWERNVA